MRTLSLTMSLCAVLAPAAMAQQAHETSSAPIQTIYIVPSSHWDLGFKLPPEEQLDDVKPHLDAVIRTAKQDPDFRWVIESVWQVQAWLARTHDPKLVQDLVDLIHSGQIELSATWGSEHTEFMGDEQLNRLIYGMRDLEKQLGVTADLAMMDDVPGFSLRLPQVLSRSGVRYFVTGSNLFIGGGTTLHPGKMPFHWQSPDGSSVLMWETGSKNGGYVEAMADYYLDPTAHYYSEPADKHFYPKAWEGLPQLEIMQRGVDKLLAEYQKAGYRYDSMMVLYVHDFVPPSYEENGLLPAVRAWNAAGKQPRLVVATPKEFFDHLQNQYGDPFPTIVGDFTGLWSEVKTNSPGITGDARWVQDYLPQAEALWSLLTFREGSRFPATLLNDAQRKIFTYDEHSGAGQPGWPKVMTLEQVNKQNEEYSEFTKSSRDEVRRMMIGGVETMFTAAADPEKAQKCIVYNPLSWARSEIVRIKPPAEGLTQIRDLATGKIVASQLNLDGTISFEADDVPSVGYRTYALEHAAQPPAREAEVRGDTIENRFYKVHVDESDGAIDSLWDKQLHRELADSQSGRRLGQLVRWSMANYLPEEQWRTKLQRLRGPLTDTILITRPDSWWPETQIELTALDRRVNLEEVYDRSRMPLVNLSQNAEFYSFTFPFQFPEAAKILVDDGVGFHELPKDYLPGARTDAATPIHVLTLTYGRGATAATVNLLERENFYNVPQRWPATNGQLGAFTNEVRLTALRKADQGDMKDAGVVTLPTVEPGYGSRYASSIGISSSGNFDPVTSNRDGWSFDAPLLAAILPNDRKPAAATGSFFSISAPGVEMLAFKPSADGNPDHYALRLQEIAGTVEEFALMSSLKIADGDETSMTEDKVLHTGLDIQHLRMGAHETFTLRLTIPHKENDWKAEP